MENAFLDLDGFGFWLRSDRFENKYSEISVSEYLAHARRFRDFLVGEGVQSREDISVTLTRAWVVNGQQGISPASSQMVKYSAIKLFFHFLQERHGFPFNPAIVMREERKKQKAEFGHGGRGGAKPKRLPTVLTPDEIDTIRLEATRHETIAGYRDAALVDVLLATGLRAAELVQFPVREADQLYQGRIRVIGKGNRERLVRFPPPDRHRLDLWMEAREGIDTCPAPLFVTDQAKPIQPAMLYLIIRRLLDRAGIQKSQSGPHLFRHTAASLWLANGMDLRQVQENLGHSNILITSRYLHLIPEENCG